MTQSGSPKTFRVKCPNCAKSIRVPESMLGHNGKCPGCGAQIQIPSRPKPKPTKTEPTKQPALPIPAPPRPTPQQPIVVPKQPVAHCGASASPSDDTDRYGFPNYSKYAQYTKARDWKAICALNNVNLDSFGTKKELKVLSNYLEDDEVVFALTSGIMKQTHTSNSFDSGVNTWLVVLTSERFLFLDHALLTKSVDTQSIRHDRVQAVSASQGWVLGKITVDIGARTVVIDNCQKVTVSPIASLANKWLAALQKRKQEPTAGGEGSTPLDEIKKLAELHSMGALTDEEFAASKAKLLASM